MNLGQRIETAREQAGLSRNDLAAALTPPITYEAVRTWEAGATEPRLDRFQQIARLTGIRLAWLLLGQGPMRLGEVEPLPADVLVDALRRLSLEERAAVIAAAIDTHSAAADEPAASRGALFRLSDDEVIDWVLDRLEGQSAIRLLRRMMNRHLNADDRA